MIVTFTATALAPFADTWGMHDMGTGWWIAMMVAMLLFWGAVIAVVVWLIRGGARSAAGATGESAAQILDRRLADGSLSPEEYEQRRRLLGDEPGGRGVSDET